MTQPARLVIFGRQGAGKGTQCDRIVKHFGVIHLSTGDMFRAARDAGTELGQRVGPIMQAGGLVPDELTIDIVRERLAQADVQEGGFVLDGFPRTPGQAEALLEMLGEQSLTAVINLDVPLDEVTARMKGRGRADDTEEGIAKRLALYDQETVPTINWLAERGYVVNVDGLGTEDEVFERIRAALAAAAE
ncbi:MAG: adenylate kinase [Acidimicrobiia bacterium]|nr:adenylate kinase [Acidimicrobiia bacterium]